MNFLNKFFNKDSGKKSKIDLITTIKDLAGLSHDKAVIEEKTIKYEYTSMMERSNEYFISLESFLKIMKNDIDLNNQTITKNFKHISDLDLSKFSYIEVYPILQDDKLILSLSNDPSYKGEKIRITSVRLSNGR